MGNLGKVLDKLDFELYTATISPIVDCKTPPAGAPPTPTSGALLFCAGMYNLRVDYQSARIVPGAFLARWGTRGDSGRRRRPGGGSRLQRDPAHTGRAARRDHHRRIGAGRIPWHLHRDAWAIPVGPG